MAEIERISPGVLASYVEMIPEILQERMGEEDDWRLYGISDRGTACGVAVLREDGDDALLRYLWLVEPLRGTGASDQALASLFVSLQAEGFARVRVDYVPSEYPGIAAITRRFSFEEHTTDRAFFRFRVSDVAYSKAATFSPKGTMRLRALPEADRRELDQRLSRMEVLPRWIRSIEEPCFLRYSLVYLEGGRVRGILLVEDDSGSRGGDSIYPEDRVADLTLFFVNMSRMQAPLYLLSALCALLKREFREQAVLTGYFDYGHVTRLVENTLGIKGQREVMALLDLDAMGDALEAEDLG